MRPIAYTLNHGPDSAALPGQVLMRLEFADTGQVMCEFQLPEDEFLRWAAATANVARRVEEFLNNPPASTSNRRTKARRSATPAA